MGCFVVVLRIKYLGSNKMLIYVKKKNKNNLKEYVGVGRIELRLKICSLLPLLVSFDKIVFQKYFVFITVVFQNTLLYHCRIRLKKQECSFRKPFLC